MVYRARLAHVNDRTGLIVMASIFSLTSILSVMLRFYARRLLRVSFGQDDWLAFASMITVLGLNGIFLAGTIEGAITGHSPLVDNWPVTTELEHLVQKYKYAFQTTEKIAFGLIKLSILFLWKRIFGTVKSFKIVAWIMIVVVSAWSITFFLGTLLQCHPHWEWNWAPIGIFLTECTNTLDMLTVFTATDLMTDFIIMLMPVPLIWKLRLPTKKKAGVTSIFMVGLFTIGAGIARMYIYLITSYDKESNPDFIADFTLFILWSEIEVNVAMIVCCMPVLGPSLNACRHTFAHLFRSIGLRNWIALPSDKGSAMASNKRHSNVTPNQHSQLGIPLQVYPAIVTSASYGSSDEQNMQHKGILARTDIYKTIV